MRILYSLVLALFALPLAYGQQISPIDQAVNYIKANHLNLGLAKDDIKQMIVDHAHTDQNGNSFINLVQAYDDIAIPDATLVVGIRKDGRVIVGGNQFVGGLSSKIQNSKIAIDAATATTNAIRKFNQDASLVALRADTEANEYLFSAPEMLNSDIPVKLVYKKLENGDVTLAYDLSLDMKSSADYWSMNVDTKTGEILSQHNWTVYCNHGKHAHSDEGHSCRRSFGQAMKQRQTALGDGATYTVYAFPVESPIHGERSTLIDPADMMASPLGWHDTNGEEGAEFTITRGNNVHAYIDSLNNNASAGGEPDGGSDLVFNFDHDLTKEPRESAAAAQVQLFYANNYMHDFAYRLGFVESAGNFQQNNYSNGGLANDPVNAEALDGSGTNNANFSTPIDGINGRMQMFLWDNPSGAFSIDAPEELKGFLTDIGRTDVGTTIWGGLISQNMVTADIKVVHAASVQGSQPSMGCGQVLNDVSGKVAMIDRGVCEFGTKALNAQNAGAVAVIICNVAGVNGGTGEEILGMAAGEDGGTVSIPVIAMKLSKCNEIKASLESNIPVTVTFEERGPNGANQLDGSFDNGVMAHEYAHGISTRLTGGAGNSSCLKNFDDDNDGSNDRGEQMGEGWSDYFTLITTLEEGDQGSDARGIGNFADGQGINGRGIRRFPYSTDMNICPLTYNDIRTGSVPHGVGEPWVATLWDLTWAMIDQYGLDATWQDPNSGNYRAAKIVMDGMKLQGCDPGYVSGRDGIILADLMNYDGAHECLIYEVFARRGVGINADEGSPLDQRDGTENFEHKPTCIAKLKVTREITTLVKPGETIPINVVATNHQSTDAIEAIVTEQLPEGLSYVSNSTTIPATTNGNNTAFEVGTLAYNSPFTFDYKVEASTDIRSERLLLHSFDSGSEGYNFELIEGTSLWFNSGIAYNGGKAFGVNATDGEADISLISTAMDVPADADAPALRFWHRFDTEPGADGGYVSISTDNGTTWNYVSDFIKNGYVGELQYTTFAIPALGAFHGSTNGEWIDSYIDLTAYKGQSIQVRWRFGSDDNTNVEDVEFAGWIIDEVEIMDLVYYDVNTCIGTADNPLQECNETTRIIVDSVLGTNTEEAEDDIYDMSIYPNPAKTSINLDIVGLISETVKVSLTQIDGKLIRSFDMAISPEVSTANISITDLQPGMYLVQVQSENGISTRKFVKR